MIKEILMSTFIIGGWATPQYSTNIFNAGFFTNPQNEYCYYAYDKVDTEFVIFNDGGYDRNQYSVIAGLGLTNIELGDEFATYYLTLGLTDSISYYVSACCFKMTIDYDIFINIDLPILTPMIGWNSYEVLAECFSDIGWSIPFRYVYGPSYGYELDNNLYLEIDIPLNTYELNSFELQLDIYMLGEGVVNELAFNRGYAQGQADALALYNADWLGWIGNTLSGILDTELFMGFTLGGIFGICVIIAVSIWFLKMFAGG